MNVYEKLSNALGGSVYAIQSNGEYVARIITHTSKSGLSVTAYVHWLGRKMETARATGGGYDRASAAIVAAADKYLLAVNPEDISSRELDFWEACATDNGYGFERNLRDNAFHVWQIV